MHFSQVSLLKTLKLQEKPPISEMKERMADLHKKSDFQKKEVHKFMLDQDAFKQVNWQKFVPAQLHFQHHVVELTRF